MVGIPFQKQNGELDSFLVPESDYLFFQFFSDSDERIFIEQKHVQALLQKLELANYELKSLGATEEFLEKTKVTCYEPGDDTNQQHEPLTPNASVL